MSTKFQKMTDASRAKIASLENRLAGVFKPIAPRKEFVHRVAHRIQSGPRVTLVDRLSNWHLIAMLVAGLLSLVVFLALVGKALVSQSGKKRTASSRT